MAQPMKHCVEVEYLRFSWTVSISQPWLLYKWNLTVTLTVQEAEETPLTLLMLIDEANAHNIHYFKINMYRKPLRQVAIYIENRMCFML